MSRVKRGNKRRLKRKKILKLTKGFFGFKKNLYRYAREAADRALSFSYRDRRRKKRDFRKLWITRINAATRLHAMSYSAFIGGLKKLNIVVYNGQRIEHVEPQFVDGSHCTRIKIDASGI